MKSILFKQKAKGIGLVEVLVSTVIIAVGLLAIASMQGTFLKGSADNKAKSQAQVLAERKVEELRNLMQSTEFDSIGSSEKDETLDEGTNETFKRKWVVTDSVDGSTKEIEVTVYWDSDNTDATKEVTLTNLLSFPNPAGSITLALYGDSGGFSESPDPNQRSSETIEDEIIDLFDESGDPIEGVVASGNAKDEVYSFDGGIYRDDGNGTTGTLVIACDGTDMKKFDLDLSFPANYPGSYKYTTGVYTPNIPRSYLYTKRFDKDGDNEGELIQIYSQHYTIITIGIFKVYNLTNWCVAEHRYFGRIIIPIKGLVRTKNTLDHIKLDHNANAMHCVFYSNKSSSEQPYACYVGGNCENEKGVIGATATQCSPYSKVREVGPGGFSGNLGITDIKDGGANQESVCFRENLDATATEFFTARKYKTINSNHAQEEGINQPQACQDFFIVKRQANVNKLATECNAEASSVNLPPQELIRKITTDHNPVVTTVNVDYCAP
ncbi:MAG: hypothetical protein GQ582_13500 [Methyloprofundus sp.]|nr:hypothetical protein [Methyloprofundus sp.]